MCGRVDVQIETVLALVLQIGQQPLQILQPPPGHLLQGGRLVADVRQPLRAHRTKLVGDLHAGPQGPGDRRHEPQTAQGRAGVRYAPEHLHRLQSFVQRHNQTAHVPVFRADGPRGQGRGPLVGRFGERLRPGRQLDQDRQHQRDVTGHRSTSDVHFRPRTHTDTLAYPPVRPHQNCRTTTIYYYYYYYYRSVRWNCSRSTGDGA